MQTFLSRTCRRPSLLSLASASRFSPARPSPDAPPSAPFHVLHRSSLSTSADDDFGYQTVNRRPYNVEAKLRMKQYRREAEQQRRQMELDEETRTFQLDYSKMYKKGDPGTMQGIIKEINEVGYFVTLPNGREGFLSAMHLGCHGGIPLLERLMKVGTEVAVRVIPVPHPGGRDRCYVRPIGSSL